MSSRYFRPRLWVGHILVLAAALTCLRLGWWQWDVFGEARGTGQNLGYALLWPVFAGSFIYMWLRFLQLESAQQDADAPQTVDEAAADQPQAEVRDASPAGAPEGPGGETRRGGDRRHTRSVGVVREARMVGMGYVAADDDDPELAAYNRALAQLAEQDERRD